MAITQADVDRLEAAVVRGELTVEYDGRRVTYRSMNELLHTAGLVRMFRSLSSHAAQEARIPSRVDMVIRASLPILQAKASATRHALACGELLPLQLQMDPAALTLVLGELLDQLPMAVPAPPLETAEPGETLAPAPTPPIRA